MRSLFQISNTLPDKFALYLVSTAKSLRFARIYVNFVSPNILILRVFIKFVPNIRFPTTSKGALNG
jgi:hypothetical protein